MIFTKTFVVYICKNKQANRLGGEVKSGSK